MNYKQELNPVTAPTAQGFLLAQNWSNSVVVPAAQNLLGGLGAGLLTFIGAYIVIGAELALAAKIAAIVGGVVLAVMMMVRAFRDEVRFVVAVWAEHRDLATQAALRREITALTDEIERIKSAGLLSDRYAAQATAEQLLFDYFKQHLEITRRAAAKRDISRPAWEAGVGMLRKAGVVDAKSAVKAPSYNAGMAALLRYLATSKSFVRTADGDFAQV